MHVSHEALTLHSPVAHRRSPWLTLLARCECLKRHGLGEREGELGADFTSLALPKLTAGERPVSPACLDLVPLSEMQDQKVANLKPVNMSNRKDGLCHG